MIAVFLLLLTTVLVVVNGRPESTDEQEHLDTITTTAHCRTTIKVFYSSEEGDLPYPECSSRCPGSEQLWIDGVVFKRLPELEEYDLMVEMIYINGSLQDCRMVPYETGEEAMARQVAQKRRVDSCSSIVNASQNIADNHRRVTIAGQPSPAIQDETTVLSHTERIPGSLLSMPIHKRLEGFSRLNNSSYMYMLSPEYMTLQDAVEYCRSYGATLASVEPSQEQHLLQGRLPNGVWTERDTLAKGNSANAGSTATTNLNALCQHPLLDDSIQYTCPDNYLMYKSSCYNISSNKYTYSKGEKYCSGIGAYPVFINSQEELDFLKGMLQPYAWIGITDIAVEGRFVSKQFGLSLFTRWFPNEPNGAFGDEDCVIIEPYFNLLWFDVQCSFDFRMVCEKSAETVDLSVTVVA